MQESVNQSDPGCFTKAGDSISVSTQGSSLNFAAKTNDTHDQPRMQLDMLQHGLSGNCSVVQTFTLHKNTMVKNLGFKVYRYYEII